MFPLVREVASVLPVKRLRYIGLSHVEADECGSLNEWLAVALQSSPLCSKGKRHTIAYTKQKRRAGRPHAPHQRCARYVIDKGLLIARPQHAVVELNPLGSHR